MAVAAGQLTTLRLQDFSGGVNYRDSPDELAANELTDAWNITTDERGGAVSRLGPSKYNPLAFAAALVKNGFKWASGNHFVWQVGASVYLDASTTPFKTFTTAATVGFADFLGSLIIVHPVDGLFVSDGTGGGTSRALAGPKGNTIAAWQNRLWVADGVSPRVTFSAIGSATQWNTSQTTSTGSHTFPVATVNVASTTGFPSSGACTVYDGTNTTTFAYNGVTGTTFTGCTGGSGTFGAGAIVSQGALTNDVREKDGEPIVCLTGAAGLDISGRPGLLAFKRRSAYRIYDSNSGAYQTIDPAVGAAGPLAATSTHGRTYTISEAGIFWTDGTSAMRNEGDKLRPLWSDLELAYDQLARWCAGKRGDRVLFSVPRAGQTANSLALEHQPGARSEDAATYPGSAAMACYVPDGPNVYGGSPSVNGQAYKLFAAGTDDGAAISAWFQTRWVPLGMKTRLRSLQTVGRGSPTVDPRLDYSQSQGSLRQVVYDDGSATTTWGGSTWGGGHWNGARFTALSRKIPSLGVCKAVSFRFQATTSTVVSAPALLGGAAPSVGAWAVESLTLETVPLTN